MYFLPERDGNILFPGHVSRECWATLNRTQRHHLIVGTIGQGCKFTNDEIDSLMNLGVLLGWREEYEEPRDGRNDNPDILDLAQDDPEQQQEGEGEETQW